MLRNYLVSAWRNIKRRKSYSLINVFGLALGFVTASLIVSAQMRYLKAKDLGIDTDRVINIRLSNDVRGRTAVLKRELLSHPGVLAAAGSNFLPGRDTFYQTFDWEGREPGEDNMVRWIAVDADFLEVFGIGVLEGKGFAPGVYIFARGWLADFAYRIVLGPWPFAAGLALVGALLLAAVGWHTFRAAQADPAAVLRSD